VRKESKKIEHKNTETKQAFLSSAISDVSSYIHLTDTKVSIIMAIMAAMIAIITKCYEFIMNQLIMIKPCNVFSVLSVILLLIFIISFVGVFVFGILTIKGHQPKLKYNSKWFIAKSVEDYTFEMYKKDVSQMTDADILENMAAELYKLNDINRQKLNLYKWVIRCLSASAFSIVVLILLAFLYKY
jgi:hypothetical protein